jgi:hypothetical protein
MWAGDLYHLRGDNMQNVGRSTRLYIVLRPPLHIHPHPHCAGVWCGRDGRRRRHSQSVPTYTNTNHANDHADPPAQAFGGGAMGGKGSGEIARLLELEEALQLTQGEVLDMERAIVKIQTWFK